MEDQIDRLRQNAELKVILSECDIDQIAGDILARDGVDGSVADDDRSTATKYSDRFIQTLNKSISEIEAAVTRFITENSSECIAQVQLLGQSEKSVKRLHEKIRDICNALEEIELKTLKEKEELKILIMKHEHIQRCSDLARNVLRFKELSDCIEKELNGLNNFIKKNYKPDNLELVHAAVAFGKMDALLKMDDRLEKMTMIKEALPAIRSANKEVKSIVEDRLRKSISSVCKIDTEDALELLNYMEVLKPSVQTLVNESIQALESECMHAITQETSHSTLADQNHRQKNIASITQHIFRILKAKTTQIWHMHCVLSRMNDIRTTLPFIDLVTERDEPSLFSTFWEVSCAIIGDIFVQAKDYDTALWDSLISEYPVIRSQANEVLNDLHVVASCTPDFSLCNISLNASADVINHKVDASIVSDIQSNQFVKTLSCLHEAFLDRVLDRMMKLLDMMFPKDGDFHASPPTRNDLKQLIRVIHAEIRSVSLDEELASCVCSCVEEIVKIFCDNVERISLKDKHIFGMRQDLTRTPEQSHNVSLISLLLQLDTALQTVQDGEFVNQSKTSDDRSARGVSNVLHDIQQHLQNLASSMLSQYFNSLMSVLRKDLEKMQFESLDDAASTLDHEDKQYSNYILAFGRSLQTIQKEHLKRLPKHVLVTSHMNQMAKKLLSFFIRQASMLRQLSDDGKVRLANDMALLEMGLAGISNLKELGASYEELGAFRKMLYLNSDDIIRDSRIDKIRPSNVLHHLLSRAVKKLQLPHELRNISVSEYIEWLDGFDICVQGHGRTSVNENKAKFAIEEKAWQEVLACLQAHVDENDGEIDKEVASVHDLVIRAGQILMAGCEITLLSGNSKDRGNMEP